MAMTVKGDGAVQRCVEEYLGEISAALEGAGMSRSEIRDVVDDVRAQIAEMLASRSEGEPTLQDAQAVIAELDAPESYAPETGDLEQKPPVRRRLSGHAVWSALISFLFWSAVLMSFVSVRQPASTSSGGAATGFQTGRVMFMLCVPGGVVLGFILGAVAIYKIRHSGGRLYGLGLAFAAVLIGPLVLLAVLSWIPARYLCQLFGQLFDFPWRSWVPGLTFVIWCVLALVLGRVAWRAIRRPIASGEAT